MPTIEAHATGTTQIAAGWANPENAYRSDNAYATSSTDAAEQEYDGLGPNFKAMGGAESIDRVIARVKGYVSVTKTNLGTGDSCTVTATLRVYNGSAWQNYQVTTLAYTSNEAATDEGFTVQVGDDGNPVEGIDVSSYLNTIAKLQAAKLRLLLAVTGSDGVSATWSVDYVGLAVDYSIVSGVPFQGEATTRFTNPRARKALQVVRASLAT